MGWVAVRNHVDADGGVDRGELSAGFTVSGREVVVKVYGVAATMPQG